MICDSNISGEEGEQCAVWLGDAEAAISGLSCEEPEVGRELWAKEATGPRLWASIG